MIPWTQLDPQLEPPYLRGLYPTPYEVDTTRWQVTTQPAVEPVTLDELRQFIKIDDRTEDSLVIALGKAARLGAERYIGRAFIKQTITLTMDYWPGQRLRLMLGPMLSVAPGVDCTIQTLDESNNVTVYDPNSYYIGPNTDYPEIMLKLGVTPPFNSFRFQQGYQVIYQAGFGATADLVPHSIKEAIKLWAAFMYEQRVYQADKPTDEAMVMLDPNTIPRI